MIWHITQNVNEKNWIIIIDSKTHDIKIILLAEKGNICVNEELTKIGIDPKSNTEFEWKVVENADHLYAITIHENSDGGKKILRARNLSNSEKVFKTNDFLEIFGSSLCSLISKTIDNIKK